VTFRETFRSFLSSGNIAWQTGLGLTQQAGFYFLSLCGCGLKPRNHAFGYMCKFIQTLKPREQPNTN